jgi:hypothetical protein
VNSNVGFTFIGFAAAAVALLLAANSKASGVVVAFLGVLLLSMILINWGKIGPLFIRKS